MWNIKLIYSKSRGFTLIEIMLFLAISSMVIIPMFSILGFSIKTCHIGEQKDDLILNGRYAVEYVKDEIRMADKIISAEKISGLNKQYPKNIGFVIMICEEKGQYRYITYYIKNSKLIRIACTRLTKQYPSQIQFGGHNTISEFIDNMEESKFDPEKSMVFLDFKFKHKSEDLRLMADIYVRCPVDY